jgi:O-antigen/teichoic acid export membrane protein
MTEAAGRGGAQVAGNATALLAARLTTAAATLVASPMLFHLLGPRQFGLWALLAGLIAAAGLADAGFGSAQVREVARAAATGDVARARAAAALALLVYAALGLALFAVVLLAWAWVARILNLGDLAAAARLLALLLVASFVVDSAAVASRATLEGTQRMRPLAAVTAAAGVLGAALGVGLVVLGAGLAGLGTAAVAASVVRAVLLRRAATRSGVRISPSLRGVRRGEVRELLGYGARVQTTNAATALHDDADRLVLAAAFSPATVAPFDLGSKLVGTMRILPSLILTALFPLTASLSAAGDRARLDHVYLRATRWLAALGWISAAALFTNAGALVELWLGRELPLAATTIMLLAPAYAVHLTAGPAAAVARAEGATGSEARFAVLGVVVHGALVLPLLLAFGAAGAPLATGIAWTVGTGYFLWLFHRASGRPFAPFVHVAWKPFTAAVVAVLLTSAALGVLPEAQDRLDAALQVASRTFVVVLVSLLALWTTRFFDASDGALVRRLLERLPLPSLVPLRPRPGDESP